MITSACASALAGLSLTKQSSAESVDLHSAHFRGWNKYVGTYPTKLSTVVLIFADGAQIRARICASVHVYAEGSYYAVTPVYSSSFLQVIQSTRDTRCNGVINLEKV